MSENLPPKKPQDPYSNVQPSTSSGSRSQAVKRSSMTSLEGDSPLDLSRKRIVIAPIAKIPIGSSIRMGQPWGEITFYENTQIIENRVLSGFDEILFDHYTLLPPNNLSAAEAHLHPSYSSFHHALANGFSLHRDAQTDNIKLKLSKTCYNKTQFRVFNKFQSIIASRVTPYENIIHNVNKELFQSILNKCDTFEKKYDYHDYCFTIIGVYGKHLEKAPFARISIDHLTRKNITSFVFAVIKYYDLYSILDAETSLAFEQQYRTRKGYSNRGSLN